MDASAEVPGVIGAGGGCALPPDPFAGVEGGAIAIAKRSARSANRRRAKVVDSTSRRLRDRPWDCLPNSDARPGRTRVVSLVQHRALRRVSENGSSEAPRRPRRDPIPARARARRRWPRATRVVEKPSNRRLSRGTRGGIPAASATRCFAHPSRGTAGRSPRAPSMRRTRPWVPRHCPSARTRPRSASARDIRCHRARTRPSVPARTTGPRLTPLWDGSPSPFAQTPPSSPSIARTDGPTFRRAPPTRAGRKPSPRALPRRRHLRRSLTRPRTSARRRSGPPRDGTCATAAPVPETPPTLDEPPVPGAAWEGVPHPRARARDVRVVFAGTRDGDERRRGRLKPATVPLRRAQRARVQIRRWGSLLPDSRRGDGRRVVPLQSRSGGVPSLVRARWA